MQTTKLIPKFKTQWTEQIKINWIIKKPIKNRQTKNILNEITDLKIQKR